MRSLTIQKKRSFSTITKRSKSSPAMLLTTGSHQLSMDPLTFDLTDVIDEIIETDSDTDDECSTIQQLVALRDWSLDVTKTTLPVIGMEVFKSYPSLQKLLPSDGQFLAFLHHVESQYNDLPYHNAQHAADVLFSTHCLIKDIAEELAPWELYATLLAALVHDIGHVGLSNGCIEQIKHDIFCKYLNTSSLELHHSEMGLSAIEKKEFRVLHALTRENSEKLKHLIAFVIDGTDLAKQKQTLAIEPANNSSVLRLLVHAADLGASAKCNAIHQIWTGRITAEFFNEGDLLKERNLPIGPCFDRDANLASNQVFFLTHLVKPVYQKLDAILSVKRQLRNIDTNILFWNTQ